MCDMQHMWDILGEVRNADAVRDIWRGEAACDAWAEMGQ
jgi:hypothetical protein